MTRIQRFPFFLFLLPLFFVFHGFVGNYGYVDGIDCLKLAAKYLVASVVLFLLFLAWYREPLKAALSATCLMGFDLFFGYIQDKLYLHLPPLSRYRVLVGIFLVCFLVLVIRLKKNKIPPLRASLFLNILLTAWLLADVITLFTKRKAPEAGALTMEAGPGRAPSEARARVSPDSGNKLRPDIYFLVFDEYASSRSLGKWYQYDNSGLDSFLLRSGFHIQGASRSNYNFTTASIASILNMSYLGGIRDPQAFGLPDYAYCGRLIYDNAVIRMLSSLDYDIVNYSIFDLKGHPSAVNTVFLPLQANLITAATFTERVKHDLSWHLDTWPKPFRSLLQQILFTYLENNNFFLKKVKEESGALRSRSRFVYAHLEMPHFPFYYDRNDRLRDLDETKNHSSWRSAYLDYLPYTNGRLKELITAIMEQTKGSAVIVLMGDHGFRNELEIPGHVNHFENLNAVYYPDKDYRLLYDSISGVNQFRVVLDKLFGMNIPILKDTTLFLHDKQ